jgi:hypothetical protein
MGVDHQVYVFVGPWDVKIVRQLASTETTSYFGFEKVSRL